MQRISGHVGATSVVILVVLLVTPSAGTPAAQSSSAARRLFLNAERIEQEGDLEAALEEYDFLVRQFPSSDWTDDALLRIAAGKLQLGDIRGCTEAAQRLTDAFPTSPSAAGAHALQATIQAAAARSAAELGRARDAFRRIPLAYGPANYPVLEWRTLAKTRAGEISLLLGDEDDAAGSLVDAIENEPRSRWTPEAKNVFSTLLYRQGRWEAAAQILQTVVEGFGESEEPSVQEQVRAARQRLTLIHRTIVRPRAGQPPWTHAGVHAIAGMSVKRPIGVAADSAGRLIVVDDDNDVAATISADGVVQARRTVPAGRRPWWGPNGEPFVLTERSVTRIDQIVGMKFVSRSANRPRPLEKLQAGETGMFGGWFLIDRDDRRFVLFAPDGTYSRTLLEKGRTEPVEVARDSRGRLYLLDRNEKAVIRYAPDGSSNERVLSRPWKRAEALAVDDLDNIYVLDRDAKTVEVFAPSGQLIATVGPGLPGSVGLRSPRDLAVDGSGRLYVADRDTRALLVLQ